MRKLTKKMCKNTETVMDNPTTEIFKRSGNPFDYLAEDTPVKNALQGRRFELTYSGLENEGAKAYMEKADELGEAAFRKLLGNCWKVSNKKRFITKIVWGLEWHEKPDNPEYAAHFHAYIEFNYRLERKAHNWSDTFNIQLPGSDKWYKPKFNSHRSMKE